MNRTISLDDLALLVRVVRAGGFRRAAIDLGLSASTVSDRVRELERRIGHRLLNRSTRSIALTEAGSSLLSELEPALVAIFATVENARVAHPAEPKGLLRLNAPVAAAELVLAPLLGRFLAAHPLIDADLDVDDGLVDIIAPGFDAGVRYEETLSPDMITVPLGGPQRYALVASPDLLRAHGRPARPEDLREAPAVRYRFPSGRLDPWEFIANGRTLRIEPRTRLCCNDPHVAVRAVLAGVGFLFTFEDWVAPFVGKGALVNLLDDSIAAFPGPLLYFYSGRLMPTPLRAFIDFVRRAPG